MVDVGNDGHITDVVTHLIHCSARSCFTCKSYRAGRPAIVGQQDKEAPYLIQRVEPPKVWTKPRFTNLQSLLFSSTGRAKRVVDAQTIDAARRGHRPSQARLLTSLQDTWFRFSLSQL